MDRTSQRGSQNIAKTALRLLFWYGLGIIVAQVTTGFGGDVGIVPRQFLRQLVNILDLVATEPDFDPLLDGGYDFTEVNSEEARIRDGLPYFELEPSDEEQYAITF